MSTPRSAYRRSSPATQVLAIYALLGGLTSFLGWYADLPRLADWLNSGISMQPNAAIAVSCSALGLFLLMAGYRFAAGAVGLMVFAIGGATLVEYATGQDLGIDALLLFGRTWGQTGVIAPGRMGPPGAISWTLLGLAILFASFSARRRWPRAASPALALVAMTIASLALIGYLYGVAILYTLPRITVIALQTATFILAVSVGVVLAVPDRAPMRLLDETTPAGALARRMLPAVILVPIVLGMLRLTGEERGLFDLALGTAARTIAEIAVMSALLWWAAHSIGKQAMARRQAEAQLVESLREADRRKNEFLATLAHELRNPLAPVRTAVALMKRRNQDDQLLARASDVIERQVVLMARLLDDLLDIGRITSDQLELRKERIDLERIVRDAVEMCRPLIQEYEHDVSVTAPKQSIYLDADPARLGQIVGNLLNNACRYTERKGTIAIAIDRIDTDAVIMIADNGIGIPADKQSSIFDMFSQVDRALNRPHAGLGIGLHLVKRLVDMHHGTIQVFSEGAGRGSQFTVRLPALPPIAAVEPHHPVTPAPGLPVTPRRVLVVDDNIDHAESLATLLAVEGHEAHTVHDGEEALAAAERLHPEVVLLDLGLPLIDGFEACRRIREQPWGKDVLLIAITGWGQDVDRLRSSEAGFDHHLVKPVDARAIAALLAKEPSSSGV